MKIRSIAIITLLWMLAQQAAAIVPIAFDVTSDEECHVTTTEMDMSSNMHGHEEAESSNSITNSEEDCCGDQCHCPSSGCHIFLGHNTQNVVSPLIPSKNSNYAFVIDAILLSTPFRPPIS